MAFLAASGLDIPDELFKQKVLTGTLTVLETTVMTGEPLSVSVSFNSDVVGYELNITSSDPSIEPVRQQTLVPPWIAPILTILSSNCKNQDNTRLNWRISANVLTHRSRGDWPS